MRRSYLRTPCSTRYAANLKRELPRIPFPPDFHAFATAGKRLMELHIDYEKQPEYKLQQIEDEKAEVSFRVTRMRLNPKDRSEPPPHRPGHRRLA